MKKLLYLTVTSPLGRREAFLIPEMNCLVRLGVDLTIIPVRPAGVLFHGDGAGLLARSIITGLWGWQVWRASLGWLGRSPLKVLGLALLLAGRGSPANRLKNLLVFPKSLFVAAMVERLGISHIHAHWASTPSTCALAASVLSGVSWSFTAHRWDLANNNLIREKAARSSFVRVISTRGREQLFEMTGPEAAGKVFYCPMGVEVPEEPLTRPVRVCKKPVIAAVGNLLPVKGHRYLIQACRLLAVRGVDFKCFIIGDGPERPRLSELVLELGLGGRVIFTGALPHHRVLRLFGSGALSLLVHPSVETPEGEHEGVPVTVMEAMAHGVPVVAAASGSIGDLVGGETGLVVPPGDPEALARALEELLHDGARSRTLAAAARKKVGAGFNLAKNISALLERMGLAP